MTGRFLAELQMRRPILTDGLNHRNFSQAKAKLEALGRMLPPESVILIVGPSHSGKSFLLGYFVAFLIKQAFANADPRHKPVIGFTALTSREGRTTPKFALHELLEDVGHPFFQPHITEGIASPYRPSIRYDETFCLRALKSALHMANVSAVVGDDAHYLVRSKDENFRSALLESLKSLITPRTTLVLCGGYELADVALAHRAHFATRIFTIHLPRYMATPEDTEEMLEILAAFSRSPRLRLVDPDLLVRNVARFLHECHGTVGLVEKRLIDAQAVADAKNTLLSDDELEQTRPTQSAWSAIRNDIEKGEKLLSSLVTDEVQKVDPAKDETSRQPGNAGNGKTRRAPFERVPKRTQPDVRT